MMMMIILWRYKCSKWKFRSAGILLKSQQGYTARKMARKINERSLYWYFTCIPAVWLKLDTALPHSLYSRRFLDSSFLSKVRSTCGNMSMAPSFLNRLLQAVSVVITICYCVLQQRSILIGSTVQDVIFSIPHFAKKLYLAGIELG
jgi:hypothetical protein